MSNEVMRVHVDRTEIDVVLTVKDEDEKKWVLKELLGNERNQFLNKHKSRMKVVDGNVVGVKNYDGMQSDLLRLCLYDENDELVSKEDIEALPSSTQMKLFLKAQDISGLNKKGEEAESKND